MPRVLVVNSGSSTLKYQVLEGSAGDRSRVLTRIAGASLVVRSVTHAVREMSSALEAADLLAAVRGVGHRIVHGGATFTEPVIVDDTVERQISDLSELAPLHNPPALAAMRAVRTEIPGVPQVAVFDTAFHATLPPHAYTYAVPRDLALQYGVRRYGFHGTSVRYVTRVAAAFLGTSPHDVNLIICHIGNGASITAVEGGRSVDTSMGLTPLEGLVMGTRSGDIDPAVVGYLNRAAGLQTAEVEHLLEFQSGLLGMCGDSDMRDVRHRAAADDASARKALDVYAYRLRKYVGAYLAVVPGLHALVFTGGVGEHDTALRAEVIDPLDHLGLRLDDAANTATVQPTEAVRIDAGSGSPILVIPTDEEAEIATQVLDVLAP
jgi:acetate kinase